MLDLTELVDIEVTVAYVWYAVLLIVKMMLLSPLTGLYRVSKKAFANPEDAVGFGKGDNAKKFLRTDPDVERVRR
ncbi:microsomal glutathione S-transferase 1 isoform X2 [Anolis carolinensis]